MKEIQLTQGQVALVDDEDYDYLMQWKWQAQTSKRHHTFYATRVSNKISIRMHRQIMNAKKEEIIDHKDRNGLNCQKQNLRIATFSQNSMNTKPFGESKYKGVCIHKTYKKLKNGENKIYESWRARIYLSKKNVHIGFFKTEIEAAMAYDVYAKKHFGAFANLNLKDE